jgi:sterol desaturase/sphingolipid hydroxylase (fatty acid hydroxylase superfamily)
MKDSHAELLAYAVGVIALLEGMLSARFAHRPVPWRDTAANLAIWMFNNILRALAGNALVLGVLELAHGAAPWHIAAGVGSFAVLLLLSDFVYFVMHWLRHRTRIFWAEHVVHHSSEHYNLSVAVRTPWLEIVPMALFLTPLAFVGFEPLLVLAAYKAVLLYQFWVHIDGTRRFPLLEGILATPSAHRVHHATNPRYLDKNFGGILMIWDRLFGTYEPERERPVYGITKPVRSANPLVINTHEWIAIARDVLRARGLREALGYVFRRPGWRPAQHVVEEP